MVRTIDRMVRDGLVTRVPDPGTVGSAASTSPIAARSLRDELVQKAVAVNEANLARLNQSEGRTLHRLLAKLLEPR